MKSQIKSNPAWRAIANEWHGGQNTMLYAVASTGDLTRGSRKPTWYDESEWDLMLWSDLEQELRDILVMIDENDHNYKEVGKFLLHAQEMERYYRREQGKSVLKTPIDPYS